MPISCLVKLTLSTQQQGFIFSFGFKTSLVNSEFNYTLKFFPNASIFKHSYCWEAAALTVLQKLISLSV